MAAVLVLLFLVQLARTDYSAKQNENRRRVGAIYFCLNDAPYAKIDYTLRKICAENNAVLIARDAMGENERLIAAIDEMSHDDIEYLIIVTNDLNTMEISPTVPTTVINTAGMAAMSQPYLYVSRLYL